MKGCEVFERDPFIDLVKMFRCGRSKSEISCIESSLQKKTYQRKMAGSTLESYFRVKLFLQRKWS